MAAAKSKGKQKVIATNKRKYNACWISLREKRRCRDPRATRQCDNILLWDLSLSALNSRAVEEIEQWRRRCMHKYLPPDTFFKGGVWTMTTYKEDQVICTNSQTWVNKKA